MFAKTKNKVSVGSAAIAETRFVSGALKKMGETPYALTV